MNALNEQVEKAFDYRGDVTLHLKDSQQIVGYVFNYEAKGAKRCAEPFLEIMIAGSNEKRLIKHAEITSIALTGEDPAAGKSWEEWVAKHENKDKASSAA